MALINYPGHVDAQQMANRIPGWFETRNFDTKRGASDVVSSVKARKQSLWRTILAADRALEVCVRQCANEIQIVSRRDVLLLLTNDQEDQVGQPGDGERGTEDQKRQVTAEGPRRRGRLGCGASRLTRVPL